MPRIASRLHTEEVEVALLVGVALISLSAISPTDFARARMPFSRT